MLSTVEYLLPMFRTSESKINKWLVLLEFSFRSASQVYGREFVRRVVLRRPLHMLRGLVAYSRLTPTDLLDGRRLFYDSPDAFLDRAAGDGERLLVGTGFCQKPLRAAGSVHDCPAGRFNHACLFLSRFAFDSATYCPPPCTECAIRILGQAAAQAGASFAVLTSALDIAYDVLLPALEEQRFTRVLFAICPYSMEPMSLALLACGVEGHLFPYVSGACANYSQWLRADHGDKPERTALAPASMVRLLHLLDSIAARRCAHAHMQPTRYKLVNHVFRPCSPA